MYLNVDVRLTCHIHKDLVNPDQRAPIVVKGVHLGRNSYRQYVCHIAPACKNRLYCLVNENNSAVVDHLNMSLSLM